MGAPDEKPTIRRETGGGRLPGADLPTEEVRTEHLEALEPAPDDPSNLVPDTRVGPYRVLRQLGRGGMGAVYLADRADDEFRKKVALKVVQVGADRDRVVRRFRRERQILAALEHPNVSRLLDGGTTEAGLPYFVMEYIDGHPITRYCDSARLPVVERVRLFLGVCSAVQYLHRNLVVHQDIKPGNILVGADGVPRLLDFGIAKLVGPESSGEDATQTSVGLTPAYASPEQVRGETVTTASDVYSLGVLLYELLTGLYPYRIKSRQPFEFLKAVVEQEPERPSTAIDRTLDLEAAEGGTGGTAARVSLTREGSPERLRLRLRGDLDDIVLLSLRKEPAQRYPSVEAFAADLQRFLDGRPVVARKGSFAYRAGKFVRRNLWGVGAVAALVALLAGWGTTVSVQSRRIGRERDKAERIASFLTSLFEVSNPGEARGNSVTAREVLDKGAERIRKELGQDPEVRAALMNTMADVYDNLGLYDPAVELAKESLDLRRARLGSRHPEVAESLNSLGNILSDKGDYAAAEPVYREALEIRRALDPAGSWAVAESLNNLASVQHSLGRLQEAEELFREALAQKRRVLGEEHASVANTLVNVAIVHYSRGDYSGAETDMREALRIQRAVLGEDHPDVAQTVHNLGVLQAEEGHWSDAEASYRDALARQRRLLGPEHADVAITLLNLANVLFHRGDFEAAQALYDQALAMQRKLLGEANPDVASSLEGLANLAAGRGRPAEAERLWRESLAMRRTALGERHSAVGTSLSGLAVALAAQDRFEDAERAAREGLEIRRAAHEAGHPEVAAGLLALARVLLGRGGAAEAEGAAREALALLEAGPPDARWRAEEARSVLGECLVAAGRLEEAEPLLASSLAALESEVGPRGPQVRLAEERLARLRAARAKSAPAAARP